jgi:ribosome maturation factor RimP
MGETPFTLEVTSPGVDRPLTQPRHFAKNVSRLLKIIKLDGSEVTGRILSNTDKDVTLSVAVKKETIEEVVTMADIKRAVVEIEFNRKDDK